MDIYYDHNNLKKNLFLSLLIWGFLLCNIGLGATFNSTRSGNLNSAATWGKTGNSANISYPTLTYWARETVNVNNGHVVTVGSDAWGGSAANQTVIVKNGGTLNINGNLNIRGNVTILVEAGGTINITGTYKATSSRVSFTSLGTLNIDGAVDIGSRPNIFKVGGTTNLGSWVRATGGADIDFTGGSTNIVGSWSQNGNATSTVAGNVTVGGDWSQNGAGGHSNVTGRLNVSGSISVGTNATMKGSGIIIYSGLNVGAGCGSGSYIQCNGTGTRMDTHPSSCYGDFPGGSGPGSLNLTSCSTAVFCLTPNAGSLTTPSSICQGESIVINGSIVSGANYQWQIESVFGSNSWSDIGGNTENLSSSVLSSTSRFRRRTYDCTPRENSSWEVVTVTVQSSPNAGNIAGISSLCVEGVTTLVSDGEVGAWSSSDPSVATVAPSSGLVTALSSGTTLITYSVPATNPCTTASTDTMTVRVQSPPNAGDISGVSSLCEDGGVTTLASNGDLGTWTSSNPSVATVVPSSGLVTALNSGTTLITYTVSATSPCTIASTDTMTVRVQSSPNAGNISGFSSLCEDGGFVVLSTDGDEGTWTSSDQNVATIDLNSGVVIAVNSGTALMTYTVPATSPCTVASTDTMTISVQSSPNAGIISGVSSLCENGGTTTFSTDGFGGTWTSCSPMVATIDPVSGFVTALTPGRTVITYTVPPVSPCIAVSTDTMTVQVQSLPNAGSISGMSSLCEDGGLTTLVSDGDVGTWTSSDPSVATIESNTGLVTALGSGTTLITYTVPATSPCTAASTDTMTISVQSSPDAGTISGISSLCEDIGVTTLASDGDVGTWTSSNSSVATVVPSSGLVTALSSGTTLITYTVPATNPCTVASTDTMTISVQSPPNAGNISGIPSLCEDGGLTTLVSDGDVGTWASSDLTVATIDLNSGVVIAVNSGITLISYTVPATSPCTAASTDTMTVQVQSSPNTGSISGISSLCEDGGLTTLVSDGDVGTWASSDLAVATIESSTGLVTALSTGTTLITYRVSATSPCTIASTDTMTVRVQSSPNAGNISGVSSLCEDGGLTTLVSDGDVGTWTSSDLAVTTVEPSTGLVTALGSGTTLITYTVPATSPCTVASTDTMTVRVQSSPDAGTISGISSLCENGGVTTLVSDGDVGTWTSSDPSVATVESSTGFVTALSSGTTLITYTVPVTSPCTVASTDTTTLAIQSSPNAGVSSLNIEICEGDILTETQLYDAIVGEDTGGIWTPGLAGAGTYLYTVTATSPCILDDTISVLVMATPFPSSGTSKDTSFCTSDDVFGLNELLVDNNRIGVWSPKDIFDPSSDVSGIFTYQTNGLGACAGKVDIDTVSIGLDSFPNAGVLRDTVLCSGDSSFSLLTMLTGAEDNGIWDRNMVFDPKIDASADYSYAVSGKGACSNKVATASASITVHQSPQVNVLSSFDDVFICPEVSGSFHEITAQTQNSSAITWSTVGSAKLLSNGQNIVKVSFPEHQDTTYVIAEVISDFCTNADTDTIMLVSSNSVFLDFSIEGDVVCVNDEGSYQAVSNNSFQDEDVSYTWVLNNIDTVSVEEKAIVRGIEKGDELELFVQTKFCSDTNSRNYTSIKVPYVLRPGADLMVEGEYDHDLQISQLMSNTQVELTDNTDRETGDYAQPTTWSFYWMSEDEELIYEGEQGDISTPSFSDSFASTTATPPVRNNEYYTVDYYMLTSNGVCSDTSIARLNLIVTTFIPNVFTPNGDNQFDTWGIENRDAFGQLGVKIYNRWGGLVYSSEEWDNAWEGHNNDGDVLPVGTYFYIIELFESGEKYDGDVTIFR